MFPHLCLPLLRRKLPVCSAAACTSVYKLSGYGTNSANIILLISSSYLFVIFVFARCGGVISGRRSAAAAWFFFYPPTRPPLHPPQAPALARFLLFAQSVPILHCCYCSQGQNKCHSYLLTPLHPKPQAPIYFGIVSQ